MASPNLPAGTHRHTGAVKKLLIAFKSETGLDARDAPEQFTSWLINRPKLKPRTKRQYLSHAGTILDVEFPSLIIETEPAAIPSLLNWSTYIATIKKLNKVNQKKIQSENAKVIALCIFVCSSITGYSIPDLMTTSELTTRKCDDRESWTCQLTINPVRRKAPAAPITTSYTGLYEYESVQMNFLFDIVRLQLQKPEFVRMMLKRAPSFIAVANPEKKLSFRDLRAIYPDVLRYKV